MDGVATAFPCTRWICSAALKRAGPPLRVALSNRTVDRLGIALSPTPPVPIPSGSLRKHALPSVEDVVSAVKGVLHQAAR